MDDLTFQSQTFPQVICEAKAHLNLSERELADELGFSVDTLRRWEEGRSKPHTLVQAHVLDKIAELLGAKADHG